MPTNDEIINKHPAKCKEEKGWSILCVKDCMNEARLATLDDCKTLLDLHKRVLSGTEDYNTRRGIAIALAELDFLRKKVNRMDKEKLNTSLTIKR